MSLQKLLSVEGNDAPPIVITCQRDGAAIDLSDTNSVSLIINFNGTVTNTGHQLCTLTTPASGIVTYTPGAADFATNGTYNCEVKIVYNDNSVETLYEKFQVGVRVKLS